MLMTVLEKEGLQNTLTFNENISNSLKNISSSVFLEDTTTSNHINRYALAVAVKAFWYRGDFFNSIVDNENINFTSVQSDYDGAVLAEWDNEANALLQRIS